MAAGGRVAGNLPTELTSFVGRRDELAEIRRLLAGSHLVTLTGVGGVGKTRLALRAAVGLARAFPDGVWLVRLDQLREQALVAQAVAATMGLQERAGYSPVAWLAEYLAGRRLLLVLDNCEHLIDAVAKLADQLVRAAAGLRVLATSRAPLNIGREAVLPVPPLPAPGPGRPPTLAQLSAFPAVGLFAERAAQAVPGFAVTDANRAAVAGICRRLEGLPLAIELAAAQSRVLSPSQIDARLSDRLGLLTRGGRSRPERQQTLRGSIEWSYQLCSPAERLLWARLSVFAGGCELDAAEGICADDRLPADEMLDLLAALAGKSVLVAEQGEGGVRYRLPEALREYAREHLRRSGEDTVLRRRHRDWYEQLALHDDLLSPQMAGWAARLFREHANLRSAQDFCEDEPGEAEAGLRLAVNVWLFYRIAGYISEGRYRLGRALAQVPEPTVWRARGLLLAGFLAALSGDVDAARSLVAKGNVLARQLEDPAAQAFAAWSAGHVCLFAGDLPEATAHFEDGLAVLPPEATHQALRVHLLVALAITAGLGADEERAASCRREILALTETSGEFLRRWYSGYTLWALGVAVWRRGDLDRATALEQESLRLRKEVYDSVASGYCVEALAWIAASGRQHERAAVLLGVAAGVRLSMGTTLDGFQTPAAYHRDCERQVRQALGETSFVAAYDRGLQLTAADAVAYALRQPQQRPAGGRSKHPPAPAVSGDWLLSSRELEVARLVAAGCSNRQIAAELVISQRTAEGHVGRILAKLGFTSRAQVAAWAAASPTGGASRSD